MTEMRCPECHRDIDWSEQIDGGMVLCAACKVMTHSDECADKHVLKCSVGTRRDQARLAAWEKGVRG